MLVDADEADVPALGLVAGREINPHLHAIAGMTMSRQEDHRVVVAVSDAHDLQQTRSLADTESGRVVDICGYRFDVLFDLGDHEALRRD